MTSTYVSYSPSVEHIGDDEADLARRITEVMTKGGEHVAKREGRALRTSHAKAHGLATGELTVNGDLPPELRQGLFAQARSYPVLVRLAHVPGELLDDRKVSTPRGMALKVIGVDGPMLQFSADHNQDWVLDTGKTFIASNAQVFLGQIAMTEAATPMPEAVKGAVSAVSQATNAALNAVGLNSANMDFYGHPKLHPLSETYYSQTPIRFGDHIAKLRVRPVGAGLQPDHPIEIDEEDGLRRAVTGQLRQVSAEFAVEVQLCTDLDRMPVEDAHAEWSEDDSPWREVARLLLPAQDAYSAARRDYVESRISFNPANSLVAHQPLGSINRARMRAYHSMAQARAAANGATLDEPGSLDAIPA